MKKSNFYTFLIVFSPMMPALGVFGRSIYIFDFYLPLVLFLFGIGKIKLRQETVQFIFMVACLFILVFFLQAIMWGAVHSFSVARFSAIAFLIPLLKDFFSFKDFERFFTRFLVIISFLGIFQFIDGFLLKSFFGVNDLISALYPYAGDLSESALAKAEGNQIKSGSFFRATSIADGHPILFGDLIASLSVLLLFWKRYVAYGIAVVAVMLTFSRGSWLMVLVGFFIYFIIEFRRFGFWFYFFIFIFSCIVFSSIFYVDSIYNAFYFRVMNTLYTFGLTDIAVGRSNDPRVEMIWPHFFDAMNSVGWRSYLAGYDVGLPTDSGHFAILREAGIVGYLVYLSFSIYSVFSSKFDKRIITLLLVLLVGMIFHPVQQGYKLVYLTAISIAYCIVTSQKGSETK